MAHSALVDYFTESPCNSTDYIWDPIEGICRPTNFWYWSSYITFIIGSIVLGGLLLIALVRAWSTCCRHDADTDTDDKSSGSDTDSGEDSGSDSDNDNDNDKEPIPQPEFII
jgi:hypothetical protein